MTPDDPFTRHTGQRTKAPYPGLGISGTSPKVPTLTVVHGRPFTDAGCGLFQKLPIRSIELQNPAVVKQYILRFKLTVSDKIESK